MQYAIFSKRRFSHSSTTFWRYEALVDSEAERDEMVAQIQDEIERTKDARLATLAIKVIGLS